MEPITLAYCETHRVSGSNSSFKALCPVCPNNNLWVTLHNGIAYCFNCFARFYIEGIYSGATNERNDGIVIPGDVGKIREIYTNAFTYYLDSLGDAQIEFLKQRGLDLRTIRDFGIGYCDGRHLDLYRSASAVEAGLADAYRHQPVLSDRIIFPYMAGGQVTEMRGRSIAGEQPKYKSLMKPSVYRGAIYPFNWDRASERARGTKTLLITEGEIKAMAADQAGYACVALPGMMHWRHGLIPEPDWDVIVVLDTDADRAKQTNIERAIRNIYRKIRNIRVAYLNLLGEVKMDIDAFLIHTRGGLRKFKEAIDGAVPYHIYMQLRKF